jgi:uncharacterized protein (TIGR03435 family)
MLDNLVAIAAFCRKCRILARSLIAFSVLLATASLCTLCRAQESKDAPPLKIGDPAPAINLDHVIDGGVVRGAKWSDLSGKFLVVEFWATWCEPCVEALPHLNALAEKFSAERVQFISVTNEEQKDVQGFLAGHPVKGWIALDNSALDAYGATAIPKTFLIDAQGRVLAITHPKDVTEERLADSLQGKPVKYPSWTSGYVTAGEEPDSPSKAVPVLFRMEIRPSKNEPGAMTSGPGKITAVGWPPDFLVGMVFDIEPDRIMHRELLPHEPFTFVAAMPEGHADLLNPMAQQALEASFGVHLRKEQQEMDVLLLETLPGSASALKPSEAKHMNENAGAGRLTATALPINTLCHFLENQLGTPVLDETNLKSTYDMELKFTNGDADSLNLALEKIGLKVASSRRKVEVLVVEKAQ